MIFLIIAIILAVVFIIFLAKARKMKAPTLSCFVGSLGSGKTYLATKYAIQAYRHQRFIHRVYKRVPFKKLYLHFVPEAKYPATLYSNIPIIVGKTKIFGGKPIYSRVFKREHLLKQECLPQQCVVVIDELGALASQWEFNNPLVMENVTTFIRFYRQWTGGKMFVTDQDDSEFVKTIRCRLGMIYYLYDFHRAFMFSPFYKVNCIPLFSVGEDKQQETTTIQEDHTDYFAGFLPYKWMKNKRYDSRCYSVLYDHFARARVDEFDSLKCDYLIDISVSKNTQDVYKKSKHEFKKYLYGDDYNVEE